MSFPQPRKEFSVEKSMRKRRKNDRSAGSPGTSSNMAPAVPASTFAAVPPDFMREISQLRTDIAEIKEALAGKTVRETAAPEERMVMSETGGETDADIEKDVRSEIAQMVRAIARAKGEIAAIRHPMAEKNDQLIAANSELDEIVAATEIATQKILDMTENIEGVLSNVSAMAADDRDIIDQIDRVSAFVTEIMEACNFQDITGQRITKVVKTMRFVEDRILAMISIFGIDNFTQVPVPPSEQEQFEEENMLNGPAAEGQGISQAEIDALFD